MVEMAGALLRLEGEWMPNVEVGKAGVLSEGDLETLLDRRPEVFVDRGKGHRQLLTSLPPNPTLFPWSSSFPCLQ